MKQDVELEGLLYDFLKRVTLEETVDLVDRHVHNDYVIDVLNVKDLLGKTLENLTHSFLHSLKIEGHSHCFNDLVIRLTFKQ